jgi:hypothetical protein
MKYCYDMNKLANTKLGKRSQSQKRSHTPDSIYWKGSEMHRFGGWEEMGSNWW